MIANGDGTFETTVNPSISVTGAEAGDIDPPAITINGVLQQTTELVSIAASDVGRHVQRDFHQARHQIHRQSRVVAP
jgi:hypothetical protein